MAHVFLYSFWLLHCLLLCVFWLNKKNHFAIFMPLTVIKLLRFSAFFLLAHFVDCILHLCHFGDSRFSWKYTFDSTFGLDMISQKAQKYSKITNSSSDALQTLAQILCSTCSYYFTCTLSALNLHLCEHKVLMTNLPASVSFVKFY